MVPSFLPVSPPRNETSSGSTSKRRPKIDELLLENADGSTSTVEPVITPRRKVKKKTQWADGGEDAQPGSTVEIVVDDGRSAHDPEDGSDEVRQVAHFMLHIFRRTLSLDHTDKM